jgi:outer membrane lipoprotein carrier protein
MHFSRILSALLILGFSTTPAAAAQIPKYSAGLNEVIATVEKPFQLDRSGSPLISTVRADFFQRSTIAEKKKEFRAEGQMYLNPATSSESLKFRFDYYRPTKQEVVCDGKTLWIYLPENRQVILSDVSEFFAPSRTGTGRERGINFLQGLGRISKDFAIVFNRSMTDQAGNYLLDLTPLRASATIEKLFITVSREAVERRAGTRPQVGLPPARQPQLFPFPILSTTVVDHDGNSTTMEFSNAVTNSMVSDIIFRFDVPPDAQVVRPPGAKR